MINAACLYPVGAREVTRPVRPTFRLVQYDSRFMFPNETPSLRNPSAPSFTGGGYQLMVKLEVVKLPPEATVLRLYGEFKFELQAGDVKTISRDKVLIGEAGVTAGKKEYVFPAVIRNQGTISERRLLNPRDVKFSIEIV